MSNKKKSIIVAVLLCFCIVVSGLMTNYSFRVWLCRTTNKLVCYEVFPPPEHVLDEQYERGKKFGVNF